jgi:type IV pilus assembly protein PilB
MSGLESTVTGKRRLGEMLVAAGVVTDVQIKEALESRHRTDGVRERLGQALVRLGFVTENEVAQALSEQMGLQYVEGEEVFADPTAAMSIPAALSRRYGMLPLRVEIDGTLLVACSDPTDVVGRDDVRMASGVRSVRMVVAPSTELAFAIRRAYGFDKRADELIGAIDVGETQPIEEDAGPVDAESAPMIRLVDEVIAEAVNLGASDVHVEPAKRGAVVRYRIDGVLQEQTVVPRNVMGQFIARMKLMGSMDIAERRLPQDGRARFVANNNEVDLRISSLPSLYGETIVIRLLRKGAERLGLDEVGFDEEQLVRFSSAIDRPQGLVLITGPTGSGKTSTLYAGLGYLADETRNVITLEDPVEYELDGINQTHIIERIGRTFARCLRTVLRQDPDVVMVGEIRDGETAELALQAAMTGHMVLSTLHTNDAPSAVVRLRDLGVPAYLIAGSLTLVVAQRLVRKVCKGCAVPAPATERQIAQLHLSPRDLEEHTFQVGTGCSACGNTGYKGRIGLFEILSVDSRIRDLLVDGASTPDIRRAAREAGMQSLREDGLAKAAAGTTSLDELVRVAPDDVEADDNACPVCAHTVQPEFSSCPWCGCKLGLPTCTGCDRALETGWRVCPDCAIPVAQESETDDASPHSLAPTSPWPAWPEEGKASAAPVTAQAPEPGWVAEQGWVTEPGRGTEPRWEPDTKPLILVVDDDPSVCAAVRIMLEDDYEVDSAGDASTALEKVHRTLPDLVLLDIGLPDRDGYSLTRELRSRSTTMDVPIVLFTGQDEQGTKATGLHAGADDHITKPVDPDVLLARLEVVLRRGRGHRSVPQLPAFP